MKNKLNNIQALRAFAVMLVVGLHALAIELKYSEFEILLPTFLRIGISGVDLFFIISGFIMVTVTGKQAGKKSQHSLSAKHFLYLRLSRIYPLYWLVCAAILAVYLFNSNLVSLPVFNASYVIQSFLLLPQPYLPLLMVGWSLIHEVYFYLVFALFLLAPRKHLLKLILLWLVIVLIGQYAISHYRELFNQITRLIFSPITIEFIAGCLLAMYMSSEYKQQNKHLKTLLPFLLTVTIWGAITWGLLNIYTAIFNNIQSGHSIASKENLIALMELLIFIVLITCMYHENKQRFNQYPLAKSSVLAGFFLLIVIWNRYSFNTTEIDIEGWSRVYLFTPPYLLMIYGAVAMERNNSNSIAPAWAIRIGDISYSVYLTHILILSALGHIWTLFSQPGYWDNILMIVIMLIAVLVGGQLSYKLAERPLLKLSHRFGDRFKS